MLLVAMFIACSQGTNDKITQEKKDRIILGKQNAIHEVKAALANDNQHNVIDNKSAVIKDSATAINVAEPILFSIYGKQNIVEQKPYEIYLIDNYWVISGTLQEGYLGGTFLIILSSRNGQIIRITHGK